MADDLLASAGSTPTPEQLEAVHHLVETGFIPTVEQTVKQLTAPFFWYDPKQRTGSRKMSGGTVAYSDEVVHPFRAKPTGRSGRSRPVIPGEADRGHGRS